MLKLLKTLKLRSKRVLGFFAALLALAAFGSPHTALPLKRRAEPVSEDLVQGVRSGRVMVAVTFGQSNAANSGETLYRPTKDVYNIYRGKLYWARDPLLGATGRGGIIWAKLRLFLLPPEVTDSISWSRGSSPTTTPAAVY